MPLLEISVIPVGTTTASFSSHVTDAVRVIQQKGLKYQVTPTATVIEGDLGQLMQVAQEIHQCALQNGNQRVVTNMTIDDRMDKPLHLERQVGIVQQSLQ